MKILEDLQDPESLKEKSKKTLLTNFLEIENTDDDKGALKLKEFKKLNLYLNYNEIPFDLNLNTSLQSCLDFQKKKEHSVNYLLKYIFT